MNRICFLFGHADAPETIIWDIKRAIIRCHNVCGTSDFVVGKYGNFDRMAKTALNAAKAEIPALHLWLLTPYHPAVSPVELPSGFDGTLYPEGMEQVPKKYAIVKANQYMIKTANAVICYCRHSGNTKPLYDQAVKRGIYTINLAKESRGSALGKPAGDAVPRPQLKGLSPLRIL